MIGKMRKTSIVLAMACIVAFSVESEPTVITSGMIDMHPLSPDVMVIGGRAVRMRGTTPGKLADVFRLYDFSMLPREQREQIYQRYRVSVALPVTTNLLLGYGKGSKMQGDSGGSLFGSIADWTSLTMTGVGAGLLLIDFLFVYPFMYSAESYRLLDSADSLRNISAATLLVGLGSFLAERLVQAGLPVIYGTRHNTILSRGLGLDSGSDAEVGGGVSLLPAFEDGILSVSLAFSRSFE